MPHSTEHGVCIGMYVEPTSSKEHDFVKHKFHLLTPLKSSYTNREKKSFVFQFHFSSRGREKGKKCWTEKKERNVRKTINIKTFLRVKMSMRGEKFTKILGAQNFSSFYVLNFFGMREVLFSSHSRHTEEKNILEGYSRKKIHFFLWRIEP